MRRGGLAAALIVAVALAPTGRALANPEAPPRPADLQVAGGEGVWKTHQRFTLEWNLAGPGLPVAAIGYRLRDPAGTVLRESRQDRSLTRLDVRVPQRFGAYPVEIWTEGPGGERSPTASAVLRYDAARPGNPTATAPGEWIAAEAQARVEIQAPPGPAPVSGISGYAVAVDRGGESWPCSTRDRCEETEIDLRGAGGGTLVLGTLPEGLNVVRLVAVSGAGVPSSEPGTALVRVDATLPEVTLRGLPASWADGPVQVIATATDASSGMTGSGPSGPFTALAVNGGVARTEPGDSTALTVTGEGLHRVDAYARDAAGNVDPNRPRTASVGIDETAPRLHFAAAQDPAEPERIEVTIADPLSGIDADRGSIGVREVGTSGPWQTLPTTGGDGRLVARWDSDTYAEGIYEFRAVGYDRAGNVAATSQRPNHTKMVLVNPLKSQVQLHAGLEKGKGIRPARTISSAHGAIYRGRLTAATGRPLGGLSVQVVERFGPGAAVAGRSSTVISAPDGSFSVRLARGPSRQVEARFSGSRTLGATVSGQAQLHVLGAVRMRASARTARIGAAPVVFSGRVGKLGARLPGEGLPVELQFRIPKGEWTEFRTVQTDPRGRFRYTYAFTDDDSRGIRFQFRAYISRGDWPYEPAASRAVSVTGR